MSSAVVVRTRDFFPQFMIMALSCITMSARVLTSACIMTMICEKSKLIHSAYTHAVRPFAYMHASLILNLVVVFIIVINTV